MEIKLDKLKAEVPRYLLNTADVLTANGFKCFLVGGAVRDLLLERKPKDFDLTTDALPEQIAKLFPRSVTTNARFGTVLVIATDEHEERFDVEVTTFRKEEEYFGGRWPSKVEFTSDIEEDLARRDFTINAIAIDMSRLYQSGLLVREIVTDPFSGIGDLEQKLIRAVRDPLERFGEDGVRAFKACRLAAELGFEIDSDTFAAIAKTLDVAQKISSERIRDELLKLLKYAAKPSKGIELMRQAGLLNIFMPELLENVDVQQPIFHDDDVYTHSLKAMDVAEDSVRLAALLHDIGKAKTMLVDEKGTHFYGHDQLSAQMAEKIMQRLKFSKQEIKRVVTLIQHHMFYYPSADWRKDNKLTELDANSKDGGWTDGAIRRFIKSVGEDLIDDLFKLRIADATSNSKSNFDSKEISALEERIAKVRAEENALKITDLNVDGEELIAQGIPKGPLLGKVLTKLLDEVIEEPTLNHKETLSKRALEIFKLLSSQV